MLVLDCNQGFDDEHDRHFIEHEHDGSQKDVGKDEDFIRGFRITVSLRLRLKKVKQQATNFPKLLCTCLVVAVDTAPAAEEIGALDLRMLGSAIVGPKQKSLCLPSSSAYGYAIQALYSIRKGCR